MATAAVQVPSTCKGIVYDKPGEVSLKIENELKVPEPGPGQVLIKLTHSGVCHSDMSIMLNGWKFLPYPIQPGQVGGHEGVGTVAKLGAGSEANFKIGDRVGVKWISSACGGCLSCLSGHDGVCLNGQISGYYTPGTFQQYTLGPANYVTRIPEGLDSASAAPMLCGGVTTYAAIRKSGAKPGQFIAVLGAGGGLGHIACQLASRGFGLRVIGIDHSSKKDLVMKSGAEQFFAVDKTDNMEEAVKGATGQWGVAAAIVLTANQKAYDSAIKLLAVGGRLMVVGIPEGEPSPIQNTDPGTMVAKELSIQGIAVGDRGDAIECLDMAARGIVKMHYTTKKMEDLLDVFKQMEEGKLMGRVVLALE